jgi:hypothetical protein
MEVTLGISSTEYTNNYSIILCQIPYKNELFWLMLVLVTFSSFKVRLPDCFSKYSICHFGRYVIYVFHSRSFEARIFEACPFEVVIIFDEDPIF